MFKFINILCIILSFCYLNTFASGEKVQDLFLDIKSDYKYLTQLQSFYDKGFISVDYTKKFNPYQLLTRDEFVGISTEIGCKKCIQPNTSADLLSKYNSSYISPFFDLKKENKYFYCIAESNNLDISKKYDLGYKCNDGTTQENKNPFCINNNVTLEEALAILFKNSSLFSINENQEIINQIKNGAITVNIANDVTTKNPDGNPYEFYGYFQKALSIKYEGYDLYGLPIIYNLISTDSKGNLNPKTYITKEDFLKMAYIIGNLNSCNYSNLSNKNNYSIWGNINIYDKSCNIGNKNCTVSNLNDIKGTYDFKSEGYTKCEKGIKSYDWEFYNTDTKEIETISGQYLNDYKIPFNGNILIKSNIYDNCGDKIVLDSKIFYNNLTTNTNSGISSNILVSNVDSSSSEYKVSFDSIVVGCDSNCKYLWNFGNGKTSTEKNSLTTYIDEGTYKVELTIFDKNGEKTTSSLILNTASVKDKFIDTDGDGLKDNIDLCKGVFGSEKNYGCPLLDSECSEISDCKTGFTCNKEKGICESKIESSLIGTCLYPKNGSSIFGNAICDKCPCDYKFDFLANMRKCDVVFSAITSKNAQELYGVSNYYQVK